ncbi:MAG: hypothetical protein QNL92_11500 [Octadecabacter sp.]
MAVENVTKISIDTPEEPAEIGAIERSTSELVIGLVGAVGAGVSTTAKELATLLSRDYGYGEVTIVKISDIIRANAEKVLVDVPATDGSKRILDLQKAGTKLRDKFGDDYLAGKVIEEIGISRHSAGGYEKTQGASLPKPIRRVTIIDSLKHQEESRILRETY